MPETDQKSAAEAINLVDEASSSDNMMEVFVVLKFWRIGDGYKEFFCHKPVSNVLVNVRHTFNKIILTDETTNENLAVVSAALSYFLYSRCF